MNIQRPKKSKILLLGEVCTDEHILGEITRLSPEAPVPVIRVETSKFSTGMGGNVKSNLESLGNKVSFIHQDDQITKTRYIDSTHNQQVLRVDREPTSVASFNLDYLPPLGEFDGLVISDYDKGFLPVGILSELSNEAYLSNVPLFIDTKKSYLGSMKNCFIKMNEPEYNALSAETKCTSNEYIITLGSKGAMWRDKIYPPHKVSLFDSTGAGDTFLAAFASSYLSHQDTEKAIHFANLCASISVTKLGCYSVTKGDIDAKL